MNTSGDLTSSAGNSGTASADLMVDVDRPGFSKSFAPSSVPLGDRSTLTFTIDNSSASFIPFMAFIDNLPTGMVIASPSNTSTDCNFLSTGVVTAVPGTGVVILSAGGVAAGSTCTVTVDVTTTSTGELDNVTGELTHTIGAGTTVFSAGKASDTLEVTVTDIAIQKSFTDDPVPPGGVVNLEFKIDNFDRNFSATGITFTDDLTFTPSMMLAAVGLPLVDICGAGSMLSGTTTLTLTGGVLGPGGSCTFSVSLQVPAGETIGIFANTTGAITGSVDGSMVTGNMASDDLFVQPAPVLDKLFVGDPVGAGDDVTLRFTITNTSATSGATDITFLDELTDGGLGTGFLPFPVTVTLPPVPDPPCGAGSSLALAFIDTDRQGLSLTGGSLAAAPGPGDSCTSDVTLTIPAGFPAGTHTNTTEEITATVDGATRTGNPASDDLVVVAAPSLLKEFTDDPVQPGDMVTRQFTLTHDALAPADATGVTFTDDLAAAIAGLAGIGLPLTDVCGPGNGTLTGTASDTFLTFAGATLTPGQVCTFSLILDVPNTAPAGNHTNTTSSVMAMVPGATATENPASDDLKISGLTFTKEFIGDPVIAGDTVTLRFTITRCSSF